MGIKEVARKVGVSTATVSRALSGSGQVSEATRHRVQEAADELGYVVSSSASGLASGRTKNIGVVVPVLGRWFFSSVIEGITRTLIRLGYDLTLYNLNGAADERQRVFEHFLLRKRVDAVIVISLNLTDDETGRLLALNKPIIGIGGPITGVGTLAIDDVAVAKLATEHLIALGHNRIGHLGGDHSVDVDFHMSANRLRGYELALTESGLPIEETLIRTTDFTLRGGYQEAKQLLGNPNARPTALYAASDEMAIGAILAARDLGLNPPRDISIIGTDDHEHAEFFDLSTVAQFPQRQGEIAVEMLVDLLDSKDPRPDFGNITLPHDLIVRSSTAQFSPGS